MEEGKCKWFYLVQIYGLFIILHNARSIQVHCLLRLLMHNALQLLAIVTHLNAEISCMSTCSYSGAIL